MEVSRNGQYCAGALAYQDRIKELEAEVAPLEGRSVLTHVKYTDHLEQKIKELEAALNKYGDHLSSCSIQGIYDDDDICTCGYWKAFEGCYE